VKLSDRGITKDESSHAQRYVDYVEKFALDSLRDLVREQKLARTLSTAGPGGRGFAYAIHRIAAPIPSLGKIFSKKGVWGVEAEGVSAQMLSEVGRLRRLWVNWRWLWLFGVEIEERFAVRAGETFRPRSGSGKGSRRE
jgi:hypothetical protein